LLDSDPTLQRSIKCAIPTSIPCISCRWICCSAGARRGARIEALFGALRATISGIAQGLQATG
jgi:phosphoenolpyruvate carboxylase